MCNDCGCSNPENARPHDHHKNTKTVEVFTKILLENDRQAQTNRQHLDEHKILAVNLMSSPGSGKTTLLEKTIERMQDRYRIGVIEGDLETERDVDRIKAKGVPAYQITTGQACHIDAFMVHHGLHQLPLKDLDIVFMENVGNLVCPASYDIGAHLDVVLLSIPEGDDKPAKYPVMFRAVDLVLITKTDLLPYLDFDVDKALQEARNINPKIDSVKMSSVDGEGLEKWIKYLSLKKSLRD